MNNPNQNGTSGRPQGQPRRATNPGVRRRPVNPGAQNAQRNPQSKVQSQQNYYQPQPGRAQSTKKRKTRKHRSLGATVGIVITAAAICVLLTFLVLFLLGFRYMSYKVIRADEEITVKYVGRVDKDGNPYDGTVIYPDKTGKLAVDEQSTDGNIYTIAYSNGDVYRGYLKKALKHGTGVVVYANGDRYEGNFVNDVISGESDENYKCVYTYASGDTYEGDFVNGKKQGYGKMTFADGDDDDTNDPYYEGEFVNDMREGEGTNLYSDGAKYTGQFTADLRNGEGLFEWPNGDKYQGEFVDGMMTGKGIYTWANGDSYNGDFVDGDMNGEGTYTLANGKVYKGKFENGQIIVGEGSVIDITPNAE